MPASDAEEPPSSSPEQPQPRPKKHGGVLRKIRKYGHRKFPSLIRDPDQEDALKWHREGDDKENAETRPPAEERIDLLCLWTVEFYTSADVENLQGGFAALGWDKDDGILARNNPARWVQQWRESAQAGAWFNLGVIHRPGKRHFIGRFFTAPLPDFAEYALGGIYNLTSSITCIVMGFVLYEDHGRRFDELLRQHRHSFLEPLARGYRIWGARAQKSADIEACRAQMRADARSWFRAHLPGLFCTKILDGEIPTCEFITLRQGEPYPKRGAERPAEYLGLLDIDHDIEGWFCDELPGIKFAWPPLRDRKNRFHAILAANEKAFDPEQLKTYGGDRLGCALYVENRVQALLSRWALTAVLSSFERYLSIARDSTTFKLGSRHKPERVLASLGDLVSQSVDITTVSTELCHFAEDKGSFLHDVSGFRPSNLDFYKDKDITLGEALRQRTAERAALIQNADRSVRDLLIQYGTVLSARENIKLQNSMGRMTWVMVMLTFVIAVFTACLAYDALK